MNTEPLWGNYEDKDLRSNAYMSITLAEWLDQSEDWIVSPKTTELKALIEQKLTPEQIDDVRNRVGQWLLEHYIIEIVK